MAVPRRQETRHWLLLAPALALLLIVFLYPLGSSAVRSVSEPDWTVNHYAALFTDGVTMTVIGRTAMTAAIVTLCALVLGYPFAYLMTRVSGRTRAVLIVIVLVPFWTSVMARNFAWIVILQRGGPLDGFLSSLGLPDVVLYGTVWGVVVAMTQVLLPFMVLPLYASLSGIDRRLLKAAESLGSSPLRAFWRIFWPLSRGGVVSGAILVFTLSLGFYVTPALLGSPQQSLIAQLLAQRTTQLLDFAGASALGVLVLIVTLVLVGWANRVGASVSAIGVMATARTSGGASA